MQKIMSKFLDVYYGRMKKAQEETQEAHPLRERRFRASIYLDVWVPETDSLEDDRHVAEQKVREIAIEIPNAYVGGVSSFTGMFLDRDI